MALRSQRHCLLKSAIFHSWLCVGHFNQPNYADLVQNSSVQLWILFLYSKPPFLCGNVHGSELSHEVLIYFDWKLEIPVLSHSSPHPLSIMYCHLVLVWPDFLRNTCVCSMCSPPHLCLTIFPFLISQEVTSEPLGQISCIWQESGFDISTLLCSYKFREVGRGDLAQGVCARRVTRLQPKPKHWEMPAWGKAWVSACTVTDSQSQESTENRVLSVLLLRPMH